MIFPFVENLTQNFVFNPTLDGANYVGTITWNVAAQRYFLNLTDVNGNLIICTAVSSSADPQTIASVSWSVVNGGTVTVTTTSPHNMPLGMVTNLRINGMNPPGYNGVFACVVTGPSTFTYQLATNPGSQVQVGTFGTIIDLCQATFKTSRLVYYAYGATFEAFP